jgi:GcrA cell cycle regulator
VIAPAVNPGWTPERTAALHTLAAKGLSASQIARELGFITRNAIIGKGSRLGIQIGIPRSGTVPAPRLNRHPPSPPTMRTRAPIYNGDPHDSPDTKRAKRIVANAKAKVETRRHGSGLVGPVCEPTPIDIGGAVAGSEPRPWLDRGPRDCPWPVGGEGADTLSCCAPKDGRYCSAHNAIAFLPASTAKALDRSLRRHV